MADCKTCKHKNKQSKVLCSKMINDKFKLCQDYDRKRATKISKKKYKKIVKENEDLRFRHLLIINNIIERIAQRIQLKNNTLDTNEIKLDQEVIDELNNLKSWIYENN